MALQTHSLLPRFWQLTPSPDCIFVHSFCFLSDRSVLCLDLVTHSVLVFDEHIGDLLSDLMSKSVTYCLDEHVSDLLSVFDEHVGELLSVLMSKSVTYRLS